jgi:hypothetical protein
MKRTTVAAGLTAVLTMTGACTETPADPLTVDELRSEASAGSMVNSAADFPTWKQGFQFGTEGWITAETPGPGGWCGEIQAVSRPGGDHVPSAGRGYAVVTHGPCNDYWTEHGFPGGSGPYSPGAGYSSAFPSGGFTTELDIFLDPDWTDPNPFTYSVSIALLDEAYPDNFRYFLVPVVTGGGSLFVGEREITEAGWYTFRHVFGERDGHLSVRFQLDGGGEILSDTPVESTAFSAESASSFDAVRVGTGYLWFANIAPELSLAIDEHRVRRGS